MVKDFILKTHNIVVGNLFKLLVFYSLPSLLVFADVPLAGSVGATVNNKSLVKLKSDSSEENNCLSVVINAEDKFSFSIKLQKKPCIEEDGVIGTRYQQFSIQQDGTIQVAAWNDAGTIMKKYRDQAQCLTVAHGKAVELQPVQLEDCSNRAEQKFILQNNFISPVNHPDLCLGYDLVEEELALRKCASYKNKLTIING